MSRNCKRCWDRNWLTECACGCGGILTLRDRWNKLRKFISNHHCRGANHYNYKGYIQKDSGYIKIYNPNHHGKLTKDGRIKAHRMIYEEHYKCCLLSWIEIHHINGITDDNQIENLLPVTRSQHQSITNIGNKYGCIDMSNRKCLLCGKTETYRRQWHKYKNGYICRDCHYPIWYELWKTKKKAKKGRLI